jgi:cytochrome b561
MVLGVGARFWFEPGESEALAGGSVVGLVFGVMGGLLVLFALALSMLRFVPSWWFVGSRALWLKAHIWLGLLSFILILCHTGLRLGGPFEKVLYLLFLLVVVTGIFGLIVQQFLPRWMTFEVQCEVPFEQIPIVCATLRDKADLDMHSKCASLMPATGTRIRRVYAEVVRPFLGWPSDHKNLLSDPKKTTQLFAEMSRLPGAGESTLPQLLTHLEGFCAERRSLARQENLHRLLHSWLYLHVPLSWAMAVMMLTHAIMAGVYYFQ